ncbi:MAG: DUF1565 domain-containing protein, partial [Planctomycetes bacterium]|nr:DUF1565 domain-containing protein [Planctomycetota bacterium]
MTADVCATDWYVDVNIGSNANTGLSPVRPFKTITYGLLACSAGDRIFVASGTYSYVAGAAGTETFPLTTHKNNITIQGRGSPKPVITAAGYPPSAWLSNLAITIQPRDGWTLKDLRIENVGYDKRPGSTYTTVPFHAIHGVHVLDLATSFTAQGLELFDNFWGIWIEDQSINSHPNARTVTIDGCLFEDQGPTISPSLAVTDIGHAALVIGGETT